MKLSDEQREEIQSEVQEFKNIVCALESAEQINNETYDLLIRRNELKGSFAGRIDSLLSSERAYKAELLQKEQQLNQAAEVLKQIRDYEAYSWNNDRSFIDSRVSEFLSSLSQEGESNEKP